VEVSEQICRLRPVEESLTSQKKLAESRDESISAQLAKSLRYGASGDGQGLFGEGSSLNPRANLSEGDIS
jgi:hypothetical protein